MHAQNRASWLPGAGEVSCGASQLALRPSKRPWNNLETYNKLFGLLWMVPAAGNLDLCVDVFGAELEFMATATTEAGDVAAAAGGDAAAQQQPSFEVMVRHPERHGQGVAAYLTYEVYTTWTSGAEPGGRDSTVRRRWSDFAWLRDSLARNFSHALVPALAAKERLGGTVGQDEDALMQHRARQLHVFLFRVCRHAALSQSRDLRSFLEEKVWAAETAAPLSTQQVGRLLFSLTKDADGAMRRLRHLGLDAHDPEHERHENLLAHTARLEEQLTRALEGFKRLHKRHESLAADLREVPPAPARPPCPGRDARPSAHATLHCDLRACTRLVQLVRGEGRGLSS